MKCSFTAILCLISKNGSEATMVIGLTCRYVHVHVHIVPSAVHAIDT